MFDIRFVSDALTDATGRRSAEGEILLGDYVQRFEADLGAWTTADYVTQWREGVQRLVNGAESSALVTSYRGPTGESHFMWTLWREGFDVFVQHQLVLARGLDEPFDPTAPYAHVGARLATSPDGLPIAEWRIRLENLLAFLLHGAGPASLP